MGFYKGTGKLTLRGYDQRVREVQNSRVTPENAKAFFDLLAASERPLLYAGGGVINSGAAQELRQFSSKFGIPVTTTLMGLGAMDSADPLSLVCSGCTGVRQYAVEGNVSSPLLPRFDDRVVTQNGASARAIAHIDIDFAELRKVKTATGVI
jgi:acetolactate synthase-1/2/3 large subunit